MTVWFSSDHHFGHRNIISYCNRPFRSVEGMNESFIRWWNHDVQPDDTIYYLGDLSFLSQEATDKILQRLQGHIHFVKGNHDREWKSNRIDTIQQELCVEVEGQPIHLTHKPLDNWWLRKEGSWHLHGHLHGNSHHDKFKLPRRIDVGVDVWNYRPVSFQEIKEEFSGQK